jgi:predicted Zn-dependent protease
VKPDAPGLHLPLNTQHSTILASDEIPRLSEVLQGLAPGQWELYEKSAESRELDAAAGERATISRRERGWAARWWAGGAPRFACGSSAQEMPRAIAEASRVEAAAEPPPEWPAARSDAVREAPAAEPPPDLFEEIQGRLAAESRGEAALKRLTLRRGASAVRIVNGKGLDVSFSTSVYDGIAHAAGRKGARACDGRAVFRWDRGPDLDGLARRLADRATLPLSDRGSPIDRGEWLLEPSVAAALLAALAPLFCEESQAKWLHRRDLFSPGVTIVDDASADAQYDGEGTATRRLVVVEGGSLAGTLRDLRSARRSGSAATGHGVRTSYRVPPRAGPRRLFFESSSPSPARELLARVRRGLFAAALTAPARLDFERDRYEMEFTGIAVFGGRAEGPVAGALAKGRISQLLRRIAAVSTDRQFFPMPFLVGAPTLLIERSEFE